MPLSFVLAGRMVPSVELRSRDPLPTGAVRRGRSLGRAALLCAGSGRYETRAIQRDLPFTARLTQACLHAASGEPLPGRAIAANLATPSVHSTVSRGVVRTNPDRQIRVLLLVRPSPEFSPCTEPPRRPETGEMKRVFCDEWRQRNQVGLSRFLRSERPRNRRVFAARAAQRSDADVHQCRHGAVQECLHRHREAPLQPRHERAEMRARRRQAQRPRQCRLYGAPPHLLRNAGEFLLRRLFQAARHRARLEADHAGIRSRQEPPAGHRLSRRRRGL